MRRKPYIYSLKQATMRFFISDGILPQPTVTDKAPAHYRKHQIPGASITYMRGFFGQILSQRIAVQDFIIWHHRFSIKEPALLHPVTNVLLPTLHYMLKGNIPCRIAGVAAVQLVQNKHQLFILPPDIRHDAWFEPGEYESFHIGIPLYTLQNNARQYPHFLDLLHEVEDNQEGASMQESLPISKKILVEIREILNCKTEDGKEQIYLQERISWLLYQYLEDMDIWKSRQVWRNKDFLKFEELELYVVANLGVSDTRADGPLTLKQLAKKFKMPEYMFHKQFFQHYRIPLSDFITKIRMQQAKELLLSGKYSKTKLAELVGYADKTSFTRAYRRFFGHPPSFFGTDANDF